MLQDYDSNNIAQKAIDYYEHIIVYDSFKALNGRLVEDGNQWCAIVGEMPENYIAGFAATPNEAIYKWWQEMNKRK